MRTFIKLSFITSMLLLPFFMHANNIQVANVSLENQDAGQQYISVEFDISWENSWRTSAIPMNWDAAWVFVKYSVAGGDWAHATLNTTGQVAPSGSAIDVSSDGVGAFIYRSADGNGTVSWTDARLSWNYGADGVPGDASVEVRVFAIEMVYVPEGSFQLGDGLAPKHFYEEDEANPYTVTSEDAIPLGTQSGELYAASGLILGAPASVIAEYPKGYQAIYCMKYEISQEQFVDFLNTLTRQQQNTRTETDISGTALVPEFGFYLMSANSSPAYRNGISCWLLDFSAPPDPITVYNDGETGNGFNAEDDGQNIACNYLSWMDLAAYLDWSGLRPATELEFEKICRGPNYAFAGEYVWGNTNLSSESQGILNAGFPGEILNNPQSNTGMALYGDIFTLGPFRCGIFASSSPNHTRQETGAAYYGIMEMGGNVIEMMVTATNPAGRSYRGHHGNGELTAEGNADEDYWPGINGNSDPIIQSGTYQEGGPGVTAGAGSGCRGGAFGNSSVKLQISDRTDSGFVNTLRWVISGGRGVRTAN